MKLFKKLFSLFLLLCFTNSILHSHPHFLHDHEKNNNQIIHHQHNSGHCLSNKCEKCLIKHNKYELLNAPVDFFNSFPNLYENKSQFFFKSCSNFFYVYSRPPPLSLA